MAAFAGAYLPSHDVHSCFQPLRLPRCCRGRGELTELEMVDGNKAAHVTYSDPKSAQQFLDTREHVVDGVKLTDIKAVVPKDKAGSGQPTNKIFVGGTVCYTLLDCVPE